MPEYLTDADLIETPQQDFLTEADLVMPVVAKIKKKKIPPKKSAPPVYLGEWQQEAESLAKQQESTRRVIEAVEDIAKRAKPFQGGLASAAQTETPPIITPLRRSYKKVQRGAKTEIIGPIGLPVTEGTYAQDAYNRYPEVPSMRASTPAEAAQLEEIVRLSQSGYRSAMDRGMLQSNQALKNFGAGMLGLVDDLGKSIHPDNFIGEPSEENLVRTLARKLTESSQKDAATLAAVDRNYGSPAEKIVEIGRGLPGMIGSIYLSTQMTGNPALGFAVQKMADARGRGITDTGELATQGILGLAEGALFNKLNQMQMGPGRMLAQGVAGAAQVPLEYRIGATAEQLEKKPLPDFSDVVEGALTNVALDIAMPGGKARTERTQQTLSSLPSFRPEELRAMEDRAVAAGRPIAFTPERVTEYQTRNAELKQQLWNIDPASPEFARLSDEYIQLARAIEETPSRPPDGIEDLRQHLLDKNLGHEAAAQEMLDLLQPAQVKTGLEFDFDKFERARKSDLRGARFYPLDSNPTKGGTVYLTPQTLEETGLVNKGQRSQIGAINISLDDAWNNAARIQETDPATASALMGAVREAEAKGLPKVSIVGYAEGQGLVETRKLMRHESFHTGQEAAAAGQGAVGIDPRNLHSREILYHPILDKVAKTAEGQSILNYYQGDPDSLALEIAAYSSAGQHTYIGLTPKDAAAYLTDYFTGIAEEHGSEALDRLVGSARLRPKVESEAKEIAGEYRNKQLQLGRSNREFADFLRGKPLASGRGEGPEGRGPEREELDARGAGQRADTGEVGGMDREPPTDPGVDTDSPRLPNIYTEVLTSDAVKDIANKAGKVLEALGIPKNPLMRPHEQIMQALKDNPDQATPEAIGAAMRQLDMNGQDLIMAIDEASAHAGRLLRNLQDANAKWAKAIKDDPKWATEVAKTGAHVLGLGPSPKEVLREGFVNLEMSELGRTWWQRGGDMYRKMLLTMFSTAANNAITTTMRLPLDLIDGLMTGAIMGALNPAKYAGKSNASMAEAAKDGALAGAQATMRVTMAFPEMAKKLFRKPTPERDLTNLIISQMESLHPQLHVKLTGLSTGLSSEQSLSPEGTKTWKEKLRGLKPNLGHLDRAMDHINELRTLLPYLNDAVKFKQHEARLNLLEKRYRANKTLAGKTFNHVGWVYDQFIKPSTVQEFFFRRPYFVGSLVIRAKNAGFDLYTLIENTKQLQKLSQNPGDMDIASIMNMRTLADLPPEVWEGAADDALIFTYAYAPKKDRGVVENLYATWIESIQKLGLAGAILDAFPKATYNGLKFAYEYSPLGMLKPGYNIAKAARDGGRTAIQAPDVSRMVKSGLGMAMFATAVGIRKEFGGEEWYQIKTGKKDKNSKPLYANVKKFMPFAGMLYLADVSIRMSEGRLFEAKTHKDDMAELYLNARRADSGGAAYFDIVKEMLDWMDTSAPLKDKTVAAAARPIASLFGAPVTPLVNLRDMLAQFDEDEAMRRDQKGSPFLGPAIDKIPWLRSSAEYGLPPHQPPTEVAPRPTSYAPLATEFGLKLDPGSNFATREFARLGLSPIRWLKPDSDPVINRAQYAAYAQKLEAIAPKIEASPLYQNKTDAHKAAFWEAKLGGPDGLAAEAKQIGQQANQKEMNKRELLKSQPPLMRKATGLDKKVNKPNNAPDKK